MFYVYVLRSDFSGKIYIGQTNNLAKRIAEHNDPEFYLTKYTKRNKRPWRIIYFEKHENRLDVLRREKQLKSARGRAFIKKLIL